MAYTDPSTINASAGFGEIINYVNDVTNQWFGNSLIVALWVVLWIGYYKAKGDAIGSFAISGFGIFVMGLLFWLGGIISGISFSVVIGFAILSVIPLFLDGNN